MIFGICTFLSNRSYGGVKLFGSVRFFDAQGKSRVIFSYSQKTLTTILYRGNDLLIFQDDAPIRKALVSSKTREKKLS